MATPSEYKLEYLVDSLGDGKYPQAIYLKNSLWTFFLNANDLFIELTGTTTRSYPAINIQASAFAACNKTVNGVIDQNLCWVWAIDDQNVTVYEIEPFEDDFPTIYRSKSFTTDGLFVDTPQKANDIIRCYLLKDDNGTKKLYSYVFTGDPFVDDPIITELEWTSDRLSNFSTYVNDTKTTLTITFQKPSSPENVYVTEHTVPTPTNLTGSRVGYTFQVDLNWDDMPTVDQYVLERATDALFTDTTEIYVGSESAYIDTVPESGIYYYRVKSQISGLFIESLWSDSIEVDLTAISLIAEFSGFPRAGVSPLIVSFTDHSIHTVPIETWLWDFGDGETSTLQNPAHTYTNTGTYTVSLTIAAGETSNTETKVNYISVYGVNFTGEPRTGRSPLEVTFTNQSVGPITSVLWVFGDGTTSENLNPIHVYITPGIYDVSLRIKIGANIFSLTRKEYIRVLNSGLTLIFD